jgi:hypothetical protein
MQHKVTDYFHRGIQGHNLAFLFRLGQGRQALI